MTKLSLKMKFVSALPSDIFPNSHLEEASNGYAEASPIDIQAQKVVERFQRLENYCQLRRFWMQHSFNSEAVAFENRVPRSIEKRGNNHRAPSNTVPPQLQRLVRSAKRRLRQEKRFEHKAMKEMNKLPEEIRNTMKLITSLCRNTPRSVLENFESLLRGRGKNSSVSVKKYRSMSKPRSNSVTRDQDDSSNSNSLDSNSDFEWVDKKVRILEDEASTEDSDDQEIKISYLVFFVSF